MERTRKIAFICVGRAVFFGSLAIGCIMLSFAFHPVLSFKAGAILALVMAAILIWYALTAAKRPPKKTEVWIYLDEKSRPLNKHAIEIFANLMREVYGIYARRVFKAAIGMYAISITLHLFGVAPIYN